jgi:hypothetical protein
MSGGYDMNDAFALIKENGGDCPGIKIRENSIMVEEPSPRSNAVLEFKKMGYNG